MTQHKKPIDKTRTTDDTKPDDQTAVNVHTPTMADRVASGDHLTSASDAVLTEVSEIVGMLKAFQTKMNGGGLTTEDKAELDRAIVKLQALYDKPRHADPGTARV